MDIDKLQEELKGFFYKMLPAPIAIFALCFFLPGESMTDAMWSYRIMIILLALTFVAVLWSSYNLRTVGLRNETLDDEAKLAAYSKAYKIRISTVSAVSVACSVAYLVTKEHNAAYLFGMMTLLILLSFPTKNFMIKS